MFFLYNFKGMFMLRMVGSNSGDFVCTQVLHNLWKLFLCKKFVLKEMKTSKSQEESFKNDKIFTFDLNYESAFEINRPSDNEQEEEVKTKKAQRPSKSFKTTSNNNNNNKYSKKKRFFSRLFSETVTTSSSYNKPIRHVTSLTGRTDNLKESDIRRFQSIRRMPLVKKLNTNPQA